MEITINDAAKKISQNKNIAIAPHVNPDGDGLGSTLGLYHALVKSGHNVKIFVDDDIPNAFRFLPGWENFIRPEEQVDGIDLLIVLDAEPERIGRVTEVIKAPILNLDHHRSNTKTANFLYLAPERAATGEIIYLLLDNMQIELDTNIAICLYTAIATDCGFFKYSNTSSFTMQIAAKMLDYGVEPNRISEALEQKKFTDVKILPAVIDTLTLYNDGKIAIISVTKDIKENCDSTADFVEYARIIEGVDVAIVVKYSDDKVTRISMRSKYTDVASIAEKLGGGGHIRAAGCTINEDLANARKCILAAVEAEMAAK